MPQGTDQLLKTVAATSLRASKSRIERNTAIRAARAAGATIRAISVAADLSVSAINKIIRSKP